MPLLKPNKSGLTLQQRIKAALPLIVAMITVTLYLFQVQHGQPFAIQAIPEQDRNFVEKMIFFGLDRIKAAGFDLSWDQRDGRSAPPAAQDNPGADPEMWQRIDEGLRRRDEEGKRQP
ncbi:MAG: hypothetical protein IPM33_02115 [Phycisphaerales bacterium]|nr:hypothetical protein [Phycisphaerales bacterium]